MRTHINVPCNVVVVYPLPWPLLVGGSPIFPPVDHQPVPPSIWPAVQLLRWGMSTNPVYRCGVYVGTVVCVSVTEGT